MTAAFASLLPIRMAEIGGARMYAVDGRALHAALEVGRTFGAWIVARLRDCGFVEGQDFSRAAGDIFPNGKKPSGRPAIEYALSLDAAKHLAMLERNERGHMVRRHFIEAEKRLRGVMDELAEQAVNANTAAVIEAGLSMDEIKVKTGLVREGRIIWGIAGARQLWLRLGLPPIDAEQPLLANGQLSDGIIDRWFDARCERAAGERVQSSVLYADYVGWFEANGIGEPRSHTGFSRMLQASGFTAVKSSVTYFGGIRLKPG